MKNVLSRILSESDKNKVGTINEGLIAGNLYKFGYEVFVCDNRDPNYDIILRKDGKENVLESKLDRDVEKYNNFYFEYWNYTYSRKTGINNDDLNTLYSHTYSENGKYYCLIAKRKYFIDAIRKILSADKEKIRQYDNIYQSYKGIQGDTAYIVDKNTFLKCFKGFKIELLPAFRWK